LDLTKLEILRYEYTCIHEFEKEDLSKGIICHKVHASLDGKIQHTDNGERMELESTNYSKHNMNFYQRVDRSCLNQD
jgi:hypothetical protein